MSFWQKPAPEEIQNLPDPAGKSEKNFGSSPIFQRLKNGLKLPKFSSFSLRKDAISTSDVELGSEAQNSGKNDKNSGKNQENSGKNDPTPKSALKSKSKSRSKSISPIRMPKSLNKLKQLAFKTDEINSEADSSLKFALAKATNLTQTVTNVSEAPVAPKRHEAYRPPRGAPRAQRPRSPGSPDHQIKLQSRGWKVVKKNIPKVVSYGKSEGILEDFGVCFLFKENCFNTFFQHFLCIL